MLFFDKESDYFSISTIERVERRADGQTVVGSSLIRLSDNTG